MFLIKTISPEEATGKVAEIYGAFPEGMPIPETLQLLSASEPLMTFQAQIIDWWMSHSNLQPQLLAAIRYLTAGVCDNNGCITFNGAMLQAAGMTEADLNAMVNNPLDGPFEPRENALLAFVATAMKEPEKIDQATIDELREMKWSEQDLFEATYHAAAMLGPTAVAKAFRKS